MLVPLSADFIILRQYRADELPGLLYSIYPPRQIVATDLSAIGQKNNRKKAAAERIATKTVKKAGIEGNECGEVDIVIQILENSQEITGSPSPGECILWSVNPLVKTLYSLMESQEESTELIEVIISFLLLYLFVDCFEIFMASDPNIFQRKWCNA